MKVVVTGARGFLGRQLVVGLQRAGGHCVRALDREVDIRDQVALRAVSEESAPDAVIHLGGISGPMVAVDDPGIVTAVNTMGAINVLSLCAELRCRPRVIYASSVAVLEEPPGSVYSSTKTFAESAATYYRAQGLEAQVSGSGRCTGRRVTAHVLSDMAQSARDHRKIEYVLRAVEPPVQCRAFNCCTTVGRTVASNVLPCARQYSPRSTGGYRCPADWRTRGDTASRRATAHLARKAGRHCSFYCHRGSIPSTCGTGHRRLRPVSCITSELSAGCRMLQMTPWIVSGGVFVYLPYPETSPADYYSITSPLFGPSVCPV